jgi:hypothetical protein
MVAVYGIRALPTAVRAAAAARAAEPIARPGDRPARRFPYTRPVQRTLARTLLLAFAAGVLWLALTSFAPGSWIARWAPCPRHWGWAPAWQPRRSPLGAVAIELGDGRRAKLCYGRPSLRGRTMIGGEAVPYGRLWRTGANEPTTLHLDAAARFGDLALLPGSYSIYTVPGPTAWEVIVNASTRQWGLETEYTDEVARSEVGRVRAAVEPLAEPVETFTIRALPAGREGVDLLFEWQTTRIRVPLQAGLGAP